LGLFLFLFGTMHHEADNYAVGIRINAAVAPYEFADGKQTETEVIIITPD